jgi:hypothetical protein
MLRITEFSLADALVIICISALTLSNAEAKKFLN